ncbi:hypothetical protein [Pseudalkalibacillus caeni]|uniref:Uncharacterized protein n=1 Tax=Exobacillus caeni TaxID=2574798 RepID=A0A5R9F1N3_9BACL|nr:hypothetical protein [Pseudalkalibacillus caeni]TLS37552.1 hypothetical protein FCL54_10450 [Pseudalkalibacillus caeni]
MAAVKHVLAFGPYVYRIEEVDNDLVLELFMTPEKGESVPYLKVKGVDALLQLRNILNQVIEDTKDDPVDETDFEHVPY